MNYYAKAIELIVNLDRQLTDVEKYVAIHNPSLLVKALQPEQQYNVVVTGHGVNKKINLIKEIRSFTGLGLKEAKDASDRLPFLIAGGVSLSKAMDVKKQFESIGATVVVEPV